MKKKGQKLGLISALTLCMFTVIGGVSFSSNHTFVNGETGYELSIGSGDITSLTSEFGNGDFTKNTSNGNSIGFHYNNGKLSSGNLIELGKSQIAYSTNTSDYIGNTTALSGIQSITVKFTGASDVFIYGSLDNINYAKLDVVQTNTASTVIKNYSFVRIVNGAVETTSCVIESITFTYSCEASETCYERVDQLNGGINMDTYGMASYDTTVWNTDYASSKSLKLSYTETSEKNDGRIVFNFGGQTISSENMSHYKFTVQINTGSATAYDASHTFVRLQAFPSNGTTRNSGGAYYQIQATVQNSTWTTYTFDYSNLTSGTFKTGETYNSLYVKVFYLVGTIYLDNGCLSVVDSYPEVSQEIYDKYEGNDLSNNTLVSYYGTGKVVGTKDNFCNYSLQSIKTVNDADWRLFGFTGSGLDGDLTGKTLSVDFYGIAASTKAVSYAFKFADDGYYYTVDLKSGTGGVTVTTVNSWTRVTVDIDLAISSGGAKKGSEASGTIQAGFQVAYARTAYIDNLFLNTK